LNAIEQGAPPRNFAIRKARERRVGKPIPKYVCLEVTHRCNLKCIHCSLSPYLNRGLSDELTFSEITGILDQLFEFGIFIVAFSGGEPLCRPDLLEIADYAQHRGLFFIVKTNGTLITETVAERLKKSGITGIHISLYGATAETHDKTTGVAGSFKKSIAALDILRRHQVRFEIMASIMKYNYQENTDMKKLVNGFGAWYKSDPRIFPKIGQPGSADALRLNDEQLRQYIKRNFKNGQDDDCGLEKHLLCAAGRVEYAISPAGEVYPCSVWRLPLGDLRKQSLEDILNNDAARAVRSITVDDYPTCVKCELVQYCARCPGLVYLEKSDVSGPSPESCRAARVLKGVITDGY
jgi:radical SAM protein with 4Fe4S-binding SPASM domain